MLCIYVDLYPQNSQTYGVGGLMPSKKLHILRKVKVVYRIEFQGESESAIIFWFQYFFRVLFWESHYFIF